MEKTCHKCKKSFEINEDDKKFYEKAKISSPTLCPKCRLISRMIWRNDRAFYKRNCSKTNQSFISIYPENTPFPVYKADVWWSDKWDPMEYGQEFDFNKPFFEQWHGLMKKVPRLGIDIVNCQNSDFCNYCGDDKNCYLDIAGEANEDCYYDLFTKYSKNCVDCTFVYNSELLYECISCYSSYNCTFSVYLENCTDCFFCFDLKGCKNCIFSSNLRQKQYNIFNKQYSKEEYEKELEKFNLNSYFGLVEAFSIWRKMTGKAIHRDMYNLNCENCTGNDIKNSKNCQYAFNVLNCEDCKYLYDVLDAKDCYDLNYSLYKPELSCELISTLAMKYSAFCMASHYCHDVYYCDQCNNSGYLFGCIGLNHKEYCILNKQYSKDDYEKLYKQIIEHMKSTGEWGQFFPSSISPFAYNETIAHEYFPLSEEIAKENGYKWKERDPKEYRKQDFEIPDNIDESDESIVDNVLACKQCGKNYKIIKSEFSFYKKRHIPIPHFCPDCRHQARISRRNPRNLFSRTCAECNKPIQTTYSPNRPEAIYCEECYLKKVD